MPEGYIRSIQVGLPKEIGIEGAADPMDQRWFSGFIKEPVVGPVHAGHTVLAGDGQADLAVHGGPDRPILAYAGEHYERWREELGLTELPPGGAFGENFTLAGGLDEHEVCIGDRYVIGNETIVEVSQPRQPCWKLARRWRNKELPNLVIKHRRGGWYFRVLQTGSVEAGMKIKLMERPTPAWPVARALDLIYHGKDDLDASRELAAHPALSADWREYLGKRLSHAE